MIHQGHERLKRDVELEVERNQAPVVRENEYDPALPELKVRTTRNGLACDSERIPRGSET